VTSRNGTPPAPVASARVALVTGGAGFVGTNLATRLVADGHRVRILDNLARPGVEQNLRWLSLTHGDRVELHLGDVRDRFAVRRALEGASQVFHLAAQVAVTTSVADPTEDFDVNLRGTHNVLEELRRLAEPPPLVFTSTNKVYGTLPRLALELDGDRWAPADPQVRERGLDEGLPVEFCTPYGCSKGGADQYVLDYAKTFGLPALVFRMSCIYGPHQHGNEDQGWVAHFAIRALGQQPITIYGDGCQVRDLLFVEDLVSALLLARDEAHALAGTAFNMGGGPDNAVSLLEVLELVGDLTGEQPQVEFADGRVGDQRYYVADTMRFRTATGWQPRVAVEDGVAELVRWLGGRARTRPTAAVRAAAR
jgi:CDP-paratose 2-epimerase